MIGSIIPFAGITIPENFLACDGTAVSRTDYADLFSIIGTTYGAGDGSTTFNLPDFSGKAVVGVSASHPIGTGGGSSDISLTSANLPAHTHSIPVHTHTDTIAANTPSLSHTVSSQCNFTYTRLNGTRADRSSTAVNYYSSRKSAAMSRSTNFAVTDHPATNCTMSGGITDCPAFDTENTGGGAAHNNMMPYLALTYLIRYAPDVPPGPKMVYYNGALPVGPLGGYICGMTR